jgi:hypothetical protein
MTGTTEIGQVNELAPTPGQIDELIAKYSAARSDAEALYTVADVSGAASLEIKVRLTALVEKWGSQYTEKSKRVIGLHHKATTTTGTRVSIVDEAVEKLRAYLGTTKTPGLASEFFREHTSYSLVKGPTEKLATLTMGARLRAKITLMLGCCFKIDTNAPSLKIELAELKPAAGESK